MNFGRKTDRTNPGCAFQYGSQNHIFFGGPLTEEVLWINQKSIIVKESEPFLAL